jgi:hypothetical protein
MVRPRRSAPIRAFALLFLLWVGLDVGLHGLFASDFAPMATSRSSTDGIKESGPCTHVAPDHCFCHAVSVGAVVPVRTTGLAPTGTLVIERARQVPPGSPHPLDRPPQLAA